MLFQKNTLLFILLNENQFTLKIAVYQSTGTECGIVGLICVRLRILNKTQKHMEVQRKNQDQMWTETTRAANVMA